MEPSEFLKKIGAGAAFALTATCLGGCAVENIQPDTPGGGAAVDFTLDLTEQGNADLLNNGGYVIVNDQVVVGRTTDGRYVAATRTCSHEPRRAVRLRNDQWYCGVHGARFGLNGDGLNSLGGNGLTIYNTELSGDLLRVFA